MLFGERCRADNDERGVPRPARDRHEDGDSCRPRLEPRSGRGRPRSVPRSVTRQAGRGTRGYSGEGFVLLQEAIERQAGQPITELAQELVFSPLGMNDSRLDEPEAGLHGSRPLITTALDYGLFLAYVLGLDDERWHDQWLAWGAGWGLEVGPPCFGWQWGLNPDASHFVIGCPKTGDGSWSSLTMRTTDAGSIDRWWQESFRALIRRSRWRITRPLFVS